MNRNKTKVSTFNANVFCLNLVSHYFPTNQDQLKPFLGPLSSIQCCGQYLLLKFCVPCCTRLDNVPQKPQNVTLLGNSHHWRLRGRFSEYLRLPQCRVTWPCTFSDQCLAWTPSPVLGFFLFVLQSVHTHSFASFHYTHHAVRLTLIPPPVHTCNFSLTSSLGLLRAL